MNRLFHPAGWTGILLLLSPFLYLVIAAEFSTGLKGQPCLVLSWTTETFGQRLAGAGGADAVQLGLWLDQVFVCAFVAIGTWVFKGSRLRSLAVLAALLDTAENVLLAILVEFAAPDPATGTLGAIAVLKFLAYGAVFVASLVRVLTPKPRRRTTNGYAE